jgi:integrase/recombinase XerD
MLTRRSRAGLNVCLWLGHEQLATTNIYLHADISHKQEAIDRVTPLAAKPGRYQGVRK